MRANHAIFTMLQVNLRHKFDLEKYVAVIVDDPYVIHIDSLHLSKPCGLKTVPCNDKEE